MKPTVTTDDLIASILETREESDRALSEMAESHDTTDQIIDTIRDADNESCVHDLDCP